MILNYFYMYLMYAITKCVNHLCKSSCLKGNKNVSWGLQTHIFEKGNYIRRLLDQLKDSQHVNMLRDTKSSTL